jgi:AAA domain
MTENGTRAKTFAEVEECDQPWLWEGYVPEGLLTVLIAPPGASKTTLVSDFAARVSRGDVWPDGSGGISPAPVIMAALEDASESSMIHKLKAARADLANIVDASGGPDGDGLELTLDDIAWLHEVAAEHPGVALIVVDTLSASATRPIAAHTGLKAMLKPLNNLAKSTGAAVVLTAHTRKDGQPAGGQALISIPRHLLQIERSKETPGERTLSVLKSNVTADDGEGIRYSLAGEGPATSIVWAWDAVKHGPGPEASGQLRIMLLLRNAPVPLSAQLIAAKTGIKYPVVRVLLSRMRKRGQVTPGTARGSWTIPSAEAPAA